MRSVKRDISSVLAYNRHVHIPIQLRVSRKKEREGRERERESGALRRCVRPGDSRNTPPLSFVSLSLSLSLSLSRLRAISRPLSPSHSHVLRHSHPLRYITSNRRRARVASRDDPPCVFGHGRTGLFRMCVVPAVAASVSELRGFLTTCDA